MVSKRSSCKDSSHVRFEWYDVVEATWSLKGSEICLLTWSRPGVVEVGLLTCSRSKLVEVDLLE